MNSNKFFKGMALVSLIVGLIELMLIINFVFGLTSFQSLVDLPILIGLLSSPILFIMALVSLRKADFRIAKFAIWTSLAIFSTLPILFFMGIVLGILGI